MKYILSIIFFYSVFSLSAQGFEFYADVMINASNAEHRTYAAEHFAELFDEELQKENSFDAPFENLPWISIQYAEDRSFRTLSWQIDGGNGSYAYDGYIQQPDLPALRFKGDQGVGSSKVDRVIKWKDWKGGIIYKILSIPSDIGVEYYLLSFNQLDQFTKQKSLEQVQWGKGEVILGAIEKFELPERSKKAKRITITYSADSNASITYQTGAKQLVVDHLVGIPGRIPGQGPTMAPDGSYIAYSLSSDGSWKYQDKLFDQKFNAPPSGGITSGGKDIFGRPKN
jgi:hypothetical protein